MYHPAMSPTGAATAAAAIAEAQRREEEEMTPYNPQDLEGWEFKILRSATGKFRDAAFLRSTLEEEAGAGWSLVEKFDNHRLRLKRPASARKDDAYRDVDPYRTYVGMRRNTIALVILALSLSFVAGLLAFVLALR